jgi:fatty acid desaturase
VWHGIGGRARIPDLSAFCRRAFEEDSIFVLAAGRFRINCASFYIMELLNIGFAILIVKIALSVLPGVAGVYFIVMEEDKKRALRNSVCNRLFGVSNAIPYPKFSRILIISGVILIAVSLLFSWVLLIK